MYLNIAGVVIFLVNTYMIMGFKEYKGKRKIIILTLVANYCLLKTNITTYEEINYITIYQIISFVLMIYYINKVVLIKRYIMYLIYVLGMMCFLSKSLVQVYTLDIVVGIFILMTFFKKHLDYRGIQSDEYENDEDINLNKNILKKLDQNISKKEEMISRMLNIMEFSMIVVDKDGFIIEKDDTFFNIYPEYKNYSNLNIRDLVNNQEEYDNILLHNESIDVLLNNDKVINFKVSNEDISIDEIKIIKISDITYISVSNDKIIDYNEKYQKIIQMISNSVIVLNENEMIFDNKKNNLDISKIKDDILTYDDFKDKVILYDEGERDLYLVCNKIKKVIDDVEYSLVYIKDMTEYNNLIQLVNERKYKYESLMGIIPEGIYITDDMYKKVIYYNNELKNILGKYIIRYEDIKNINSFKSKEDINKKYDEVNRLTIVNKYNENIDIEQTEISISKSGNKNIGIIKNVTDIVKKEKLQEEIAQNKYANKIKEQFFVNMSHELKTPMNLIYSANQLLENVYKYNLDYEDHKEIEHSITSVRDNTYAIMKLIDNIMDLAKLESNFYDDDKEYYNLVDIIENLCMEFNKYCINNNINIIFDTYEEEVIANIDYKNIEKMIVTLVSMVLRYSVEDSIINVELVGSSSKNKDKVIIKNIYGFNEYNYLNDKHRKSIDIGMQVAKLISRMYNCNIDINIDNENSIIIEVEIETCSQVLSYKEGKSEISKDIVYSEFMKICNL